MTEEESEGRSLAVFPWILLFTFTLSYPFVPAAFDQLVGGDAYSSVRRWFDLYGLRAAAAALLPLAATALIYAALGRRSSAALRVAISAPVWPLSSLLLFEVARKPAEVSEISVYFSIVLSLLFHFCGELGLLRRKLPCRAGKSAWEAPVSWTLGLTFVGLVAVVPPLFLAMRVLGIQTPGPDPRAEWFAVGSFSAHALFYALLGTLLFLRLPRNVAYLMRLPAEPCRVFVSYAEEDSGWAAKARRVLEEHGLMVSAYEREMVGGEDIEGWVEEEIGNATVVVVLVSDESLRSDWVNREFAMARTGGKLILPVATRGIEDVSAWGTALGAKIRRLRVVEGLDDLPTALRQHLGF